MDRDGVQRYIKEKKNKEGEGDRETYANKENWK